MVLLNVASATAKTRSLLAVLSIGLIVCAGAVLLVLQRRDGGGGEIVDGMDTVVSRTCQMAMYETSKAIARYREVHGEWPQSLDELIPDFLAGCPRCPWDFVKYRPSQLYCPPGVPDFPVLSCERHLPYGKYLYVAQWGDQPPGWPERQWRYVPCARRPPSAGEGRRAFEACEVVLISVAGALWTYRDQVGQLPRRLDQLLPTYVSDLPHCPCDVLEGRISYLYTPKGNEEVPLVTCERHWDQGYNLLIDREFHVRKVKKTVDPEKDPCSYDWRAESILIK